MPSIRPVSDLRNHFAEITRYEEQQFESKIYDKLREAEIQAMSTQKRLSHKDVIDAAHKKMGIRRDSGSSD